MPTVSCLICAKKFSAQKHCNRHVRNIHKVEPTPVPCLSSKLSGFACLETDPRCEDRLCGTFFRTRKDLITHLENSHSKDFHFEMISFPDISAFLNWKRQIECGLNVRYYKNTKDKNKISYYYCNRTMRPNTVRDPDKMYKRKPKKQGSCKMDSHCTSSLKVTEFETRVEVVWCITHYGHDAELKHIRLSIEDKQMIAEKLIKGATLNQILESTQEYSHQQLKRIGLLKSKDIYNIKTSCNLNSLNNVNKNKRNNNNSNNDNDNNICSTDLTSMKDKVKEKLNKCSNLDVSYLEEFVLKNIYSHLTEIEFLSTGRLKNIYEKKLDFATKNRETTTCTSISETIIETQLPIFSLKDNQKNKHFFQSSKDSGSHIRDIFDYDKHFISNSPTYDHQYLY